MVGGGESGAGRASDYFQLLLVRAIEAERRGNYAISAALSLSRGGVELITLGANTVFKSRDPAGHAEMNAIRLAHLLGVLEHREGSSQHALKRPHRDVIVRPSPEDRSETVLYTTLEPCPMCTVCIINAGINRVVIAAEDPQAGALSPERLASLPPLWPQLAESIDLDVCFSQSDEPSATATFLEPELRQELIEVFLRSRERLDRSLAGRGVLDFDAIHAAVAPEGHTGVVGTAPFLESSKPHDNQKASDADDLEQQKAVTPLRLR